MNLNYYKLYIIILILCNVTNTSLSAQKKNTIDYNDYIFSALESFKNSLNNTSNENPVSDNFINLFEDKNYTFFEDVFYDSPQGITSYSPVFTLQRYLSAGKKQSAIYNDFRLTIDNREYYYQSHESFKYKEFYNYKNVTQNIENFNEGIKKTELIDSLKSKNGGQYFLFSTIIKGFTYEGIERKIGQEDFGPSSFDLGVYWIAKKKKGKNIMPDLPKIIGICRASGPYGDMILVKKPECPLISPPELESIATKHLQNLQNALPSKLSNQILPFFEKGETILSDLTQDNVLDEISLQTYIDSLNNTQVLKQDFSITPQKDEINTEDAWVPVIVKINTSLIKANNDTLHNSLALKMYIKIDRCTKKAVITKVKKHTTLLQIIKPVQLNNPPPTVFCTEGSYTIAKDSADKKMNDLERAIYFPDTASSFLRSSEWGLLSPTASIEVSNLRKPTITYTMSDYPEHLDRLPYDTKYLALRWSLLNHDCNENEKEYVFYYTYLQHFDGINRSISQYSDLTTKKVEIHVKKLEREFVAQITRINVVGTAMPAPHSVYRSTTLPGIYHH